MKKEVIWYSVQKKEKPKRYEGIQAGSVFRPITDHEIREKKNRC